MGDPPRLTLSDLPVAPTDLAADVPQVDGVVVGRICPPACRVDPAQVPDVVMNKTGSYRKKKEENDSFSDGSYFYLFLMLLYILLLCLVSLAECELPV